MFVGLNNDCINYLCQFVSYVDILSFKLVHKLNYNTIILPNFKTIFIKRLLEHQVVFSEQEALSFCNHLYKTGAYVTGSFILDCLYDTNFHNDIDVYDQSTRKKDHKYDYFSECCPNNLQFNQYLYQTHFQNTNKGVTNCVTNAEQCITPRLRTYINQLHPLCHTNHTDFKDSIQIIPIGLKRRHNERSTIPRFIKASFDLDICQNIFDGRQLYIKNVNKLIYKYDYIKINTLFSIGIYEVGRDVDERQHVTEKRANKYRERGFHITKHPLCDEMIHTTNYLLETKCNHNQRNIIKCIDDGNLDLSLYDIY